MLGILYVLVCIGTAAYPGTVKAEFGQDNVVLQVQLIYSLESSLTPVVRAVVCSTLDTMCVEARNSSVVDSIVVHG